MPSLDVEAEFPGFERDAVGELEAVVPLGAGGRRVTQAQGDLKWQNILFADLSIFFLNVQY
jgi:hypothetical protein